ncbi:hypothetical protein U1Q18_001400 [Sarracenia purpurea var. burkii]
MLVEFWSCLGWFCCIVGGATSVGLMQTLRATSIEARTNSMSLQLEQYQLQLFRFGHRLMELFELEFSFLDVSTAGSIAVGIYLSIVLSFGLYYWINSS